MVTTSRRTDTLDLRIAPDGLISLTVAGWPGFRLAGADATVDTGLPAARLVGRTLGRGDPPTVEIEDHYEPGLVLRRRVTSALDDNAVVIRSELANTSGHPFELTGVELLRCGGVALGTRPDGVRVYEQGGCWERVRTLGRAPSADRASGEQDATQAPQEHHSQYVWVAYDASARMALLVGFLTGERWTGHIRSVGRSGAMLDAWSVGFDGGKTRIAAGHTVALEAVTISAGPDPWRLLCAYGERVREEHGVEAPKSVPVSWCSWYPYRLGVTDERALATARIAAERLKPLGLRIIELDLGWQAGYLPSAFAENEQFPRGLKALAADLTKLGFDLGAWCAPFTVSAHDPLVREHPDWLLSTARKAGEPSTPQPTGTWFWEPHGETYALDLTHPGAQEWLRGKVRSLGERGVAYLKPDFIGGVAASHLTGRHDTAIVAGGGAEASRIGMRMLRDELVRKRPDALVLNCGGPEIPGSGACPLLYTCEDTGNTGYVGWRHLQNDYGRNVAGHLWKNRRWGVLQPSCMVVGLPGGIEEARLRATATFLAGGQVDIGDDLTTLPEDRWRILTATLPPLGRSATPIDLFEPIESGTIAYDSLASGRGPGDEQRASEEASRVWTLAVDADWDNWWLVGLFNYDTNDDVEYGKAQITRFLLPPWRLGFNPAETYWCHEFWSGQFLGASPFDRPNPRGYRHPGDAQAMISPGREGTWEVSFFGPGVKLLVVRRARKHPWPVGTTFHQSGGSELEGVAWQGATLRGVLRRPAGQSGEIIIAAAGLTPHEARVGRRRVPWRNGAGGSIVLPILTESERTRWEVRF